MKVKNSILALVVVFVAAVFPSLPSFAQYDAQASLGAQWLSQKALSDGSIGKPPNIPSSATAILGLSSNGQDTAQEKSALTSSQTWVTQIAATFWQSGTVPQTSQSQTPDSPAY
jgi:hypothetical protein